MAAVICCGGLVFSLSFFDLIILDFNSPLLLAHPLCSTLPALSPIMALSIEYTIETHEPYPFLLSTVKIHVIFILLTALPKH